MEEEVLKEKELIQELRQRIRARMDGVLASSMRNSGHNYKYNFGLSIPHIRELAEGLPHTKSLAEQLLKAQLRELRILGLIIYPPEELSSDRALSLFEDLETAELKDIYAFHLLSTLDENSPIYSAFLEDKEKRLILLSAFNRRLLLKKTIREEQIEYLINEIAIIDWTKTAFSPIEITFLERLTTLPNTHKSLRTLIEKWEANAPNSDEILDIIDLLKSLIDV